MHLMIIKSKFIQCQVPTEIRSPLLCLPMVYIHYLNKLVITKLEEQLVTTARILLFDFRIMWFTFKRMPIEKGKRQGVLLFSNDW